MTETAVFYWGAYTSYLRATRKETSYSDQTVTFASHSKIQKVVRPTRSPRQQLPSRRTKNGDLPIVFQSGRAKDLSAPLYKKLLHLYWTTKHHIPTDRALHKAHKLLSISADEKGRRPVEITGIRRSGREPGTLDPVVLYIFLSFSLVSLSIVQINPFTPPPSHSATESQFSPLAGGESEKIFHRYPNPLSAALRMSIL